MVLLHKVLKSSLLPSHLILKNLDLGLQLDILLFVSVCCLLELKHFLLQLLWQFVCRSHVAIDTLSHHTHACHSTFVLTIDLGAVALTGSSLLLLGRDVLHGVG